MSGFQTEPRMPYDPEHKIHYQVFGYTEFIDYCLNTPIREGNGDSSLKDETGENPWTGTNTFDEAVDYAKHGWDAGLKDMAEYVETESTLINVEHNIVGHAVDVGRFITGMPDTMISFYDDNYRNKTPLTIYTKLTYHGDIGGEEAMEYCGKILETIAILNRTFNVRLVGVFLTNHNKTGTDMVCVNIKDTDEAFVMNNLAFAYNPSFFRRFWFKWLETTNFWEGGYGRTPQGKFGQGKDGECLTKILPPNEQVFFMPDIYDRKQIVPQKIAQELVEEQTNRRG
jgi:hypothetical protein